LETKGVKRFLNGNHNRHHNTELKSWRHEIRRHGPH